MKSTIREKRKLVFDQKRITPKAVRQIASIVDSEVQKLDNSKEILVVYSLDATDDSSFESSAPDIFSETELMEDKTIRKISMRLATTECHKNIEIQIIQTQKSDPENYILVSGDDSNWVNGILTRFAEIINGSEEQPQNNFLIGWSLAAAYFVFNVLFYHVLLSLKKYLNSDLSGMILIGSWIGTYVVAAHLYEALTALWPAVELQTGPQYLKTPRWKRDRLTQILLIVIIPIVLAGVYDLIKFFLLP